MSNQSRPGDVRYLRRPHIDQLLIDAFQKPLTAVIAGAGYGKTRAVSSALESMRCAYVWLQVSDLDNLVSIFWKRLVLAVEAHNSDLAERLGAIGFPDSPASLSRLLRMIEDALKKERVVLIFDDFHSLHDQRALSLIKNLIWACVPNLSIVLISREQLGFPLMEMVSKNLMTRITEAELRLSKDEMAAYFEMQGELLGAGLISNLYAYTEGWVLAIYLVNLALKRGAGHDLNLISRAKNDIYALIEEEILHAASNKLQKFLTVVAVLDVAPAGLLRELSKDAPEVFEEMNSLNLLIWYDRHSDRYQMHRLLKDFLTERMPPLTIEESVKTHLTAAQWYRDHHQLAESINHYWECGRYSEVHGLILSFRRRASEDEAESFISAIDQSPIELIEAKPILRVVKAKYLFNNNRIHEAQEVLNSMREEYEALPPTREHLALLGEVYIFLALISIVKQNLDFVPLFKKADEYLPHGSDLIDYNIYYFAEGINITGIKNPIPGELKRYRDAMFEAAPHAARVMNGCSYGMEYLNATDAAFMVGDMKGAEKNVHETIYRAQLQHQYGIEFMANFYLMRILFYKGDFTQIALLLMRLREHMERLKNADCMVLYDIIEGWYYVKIGQPTKVSKWILFDGESKKLLAPVVLGREYLVRSDCMLEEGRDLELLGYMKQTDVLYEERGVLYALIQNRITESIIHFYQGNQRESFDALQAAYNLSHPNNLVMQYIEYGNRMRTVVHSAMQDESCDIPKSWLEMIHTKSSTYAKRLSQIAKSYNDRNAHSKKEQIPLSKRELEVLSCLCHGFTRDEIADACYLSASTVKNVQQSIYSKLGAINSLDAVRIATLMDLV